MNLGSPDLERAVRRAAEAEIRQSEKRWRVYRWQRWMSRMRAVGMWIVLLGVPTFAFMPSIFFVCLVGPAGLGKSGPHAGKVNNPELVFVLHSLVVAGLLCASAGGTNRGYLGETIEWTGFFPQTSLRMIAYLPVSDRHLLQARRMEAVLPLSAFLLFILLPFGYTAWRAAIPSSSWLFTTGIASLQIVTLVAIGCILAAHVPQGLLLRKVLVIVGIPLILLGILLGLVAVNLPSDATWLIEATIWLNPAGWVGAAYVYGFIGGSAAAWWTLTPVLVVIAIAVPVLVEYLRADFAIKEFVVGPRGEWYGVIEKGFRVPAEFPEPPPLFGPKSIDPAGDVRLPAGTAEDRVLAGEYLKAPAWHPQQFVQRFCDLALTPRDRAILRYRSDGYEAMTVQWKLFLRGLVGCLVVAVLLQSVTGDDLLTVFTFAPIFLLFFTNHILPSQGYEEKQAVFRDFPVAFGEMSRAVLKCEAMRILSVSPLIIGYGFAVAKLCGVAPWQGIASCLIPLGTFLSGHPINECLLISSSTNDTKRISMKALWYASLPCVAVLALATVVPEALPVRLTALVLCAGISVGFWLFYVRAYRRGDFDLIRSAQDARNRRTGPR